MNPSTITAIARNAARLAAAGAGSTWVLATLFSQHPSRSFDWPRKFDPSGTLIPNWRFFAPNPAIHDNRLAHRVVWSDGEHSEWLETHDIAERSWRDPFWCPGRRRDKAVTDMCNNLLVQLVDRRSDRIESSPCYQMMSQIVRQQISNDPENTSRGVRGYQFVVARDPGYDEEGELDLLFASRFEPWLAAPEPVGVGG